jgi:hypothetical protein
MTLILNGTNGLSDVDGSASTPAIRGTDTNTGIFFPAADTIAFAEGGAEVARFDSSGRFTAPFQTGFKANKLTSTQTITAGTWTRVGFNSVGYGGGFNTGSCYSGATNRFTAPVAGKYIFTASVNINAAAAGQMYIDFGINGSNNVGMEASVAYPVGDTTIATSTVISMVANDTMEVNLFTTTATTAGNRICGFSGQLLS